LDIFKILEFFEKLFGIFSRFLGFFLDFLGNLSRIFMEEFFGMNSLFTLELISLSRFCLKAEEGSKEGKFQSFEVRAQAHRT
jgi:hypothetical protein